MAFTKFNSFLEDLAAGGVHDLTADTLKIYLSNTAPNAATHEIKADIAEIATGGGYSGPVAPTITSRGIVGGQYVITPSGPVIWTGTGSGFGPLQYAILYNDTSTGDKLIGWWNYPTQITLIDVDETLTLNISSSNGLLKLI